MVSDAELVERLREFLRVSDLATTTTAIVRRKLEEDFGVDLTDKKVFIREQVDLFLSELENEKKEAEEEEEGGGGEGADGDGGEGSSEEDEEDEDEEETSNGSSRKRGSNKNKEVKKRGGGFTKLCSLSPQLQKFVGVSELARTEVVRKLWAYIRENNLQDPGNKRTIICDESLQTLFNVNTIDMFQMNKSLSKHIWPITSEDAGPAKSKQKEKKQKKDREGSDESPQKGKRKKGGSSGFLAPLQLSDALMKFIGTGENELPRSDVVKRMWDYIKQNNLQDPADKRNILCDDKLKELFQVDSFTGFTVPKLLVAHFIKSKQ